MVPCIFHDPQRQAWDMTKNHILLHVHQGIKKPCSSNYQLQLQLLIAIHWSFLGKYAGNSTVQETRINVSPAFRGSASSSSCAFASSLSLVVYFFSIPFQYHRQV